MLSDILLRGLPAPVRLFGLVGLVFVALVFGSAVVSAASRAIAPQREVPVASLHTAVDLTGPHVLQRRAAPQRRPAAVAPRALARGIHAPKPPAASAPAPEPVAPAPAVPLPAAWPEVQPNPPGSRALPPLTHVVPVPIESPSETPIPPAEPPSPPPAEENPPAEPPPEEPPPEEPPPEEPPAEEPVPTPVPPLAPGLSFRGDQIRDFAVAQSAPGAITEVPDPAGSGETVFKMTVSDNDGYPVTPTENPRAELISPFAIEAGEEFWWSAKFFLPAEFPASTPNFVTLLQGPFGPPASGTPPFHIEANSGVLKWQRNATYGWDIPWQMPEVRNQWVDVMVHERFASNGFLELWIGGQQVTFFASSSYNPGKLPPTTRLEMATLDSSNNGGPQALFLQQYRKKGMYPSLTVYQGPLRIGTTREAVEG